MNEQPEQLIRALANLRLSPTERATMRHFLTAQARFEPSRHRGWAFFTRHAIAAGALAVVLIAGATGVAAQRSRPGDLLYSVKTDVTDRVVLALETDELDRLERELAQTERMFAEEERTFEDELRSAESEDSDDREGKEADDDDNDDSDKRGEDRDDEDEEDKDDDDDDRDDSKQRVSPTPDELELELRQLERELDEEAEEADDELSL